MSRIDTVTEAEGKKTRRCWVYLGSFEKDREVLEGMQPIKVPIGGDESQQHTAQAAVLTDQEIRMCVQDVSLDGIFLLLSSPTHVSPFFFLVRDSRWRKR